MKLALLACLVAGWAGGQTPLPQTPEVLPPPAGQVVVSAGHPPAVQAAESSSSQDDVPGPPDRLPATPVADAEREAFAVVSWQMDVHLKPAEAGLGVQATVVLRNRGKAPLARVPLDVSGTLRWQTVSLTGAQGLTPVAFTQSPVATDADHTGRIQEAVVTLPTPLAPGASVTLVVFYQGTVHASSARLQALGAAADRAEETDWDAIVPTTDAGATALRGFGDVLWYPVCAPLAELGEGNELFALIARERVQEARATMAMHLSVEYAGDPPNAAILNGRVATLLATPDDSEATVEDSAGVATADFAAASPGLNGASLFLTAQHIRPGTLLDIVTPRAEAAGPYVAAAGLVAPLLEGWFGPAPIAPLLLLDHAGEPFRSGAFLAGQLAPSAEPQRIAPLLVDGLTHAWFPSRQPWIGEGVAEWMRLSWLEREHGRAAAEAAMEESARTVAFAEPDFASGDGAQAMGQPLVMATSPVFFRQKAAFVWLQLRALVGDEALRHALSAYRANAQRSAAYDDDAHAMQRALELASGKELGWFFDDWVYRDRGLPDLTIVQVNPRPLPARAGKDAGYLVAVEVRNDGDAVADVPVTVRAGTAFVSTERLRIGPHATASTRVLFETVPESVEVNDGTVPETRSSTHVQAIALP